MANLRSAALPALRDDDHLRGKGAAPLLIEYADLECPYCAALEAKLTPLVAQGAARVAFRHFPLRSTHPRAWALACASEAANLQGGFWAFHDSVFSDQGHIDDPHLWRRVQELGLDVERFDRDRRSDPVLARVRRDFSDAVRAGVVTAPTAFSQGRAYYGEQLAVLMAELGRAHN